MESSPYIFKHRYYYTGLESDILQWNCVVNCINAKDCYSFPKRTILVKEIYVMKHDGGWILDVTFMMKRTEGGGHVAYGKNEAPVSEFLPAFMGWLRTGCVNLGEIKDETDK